MFSLVERFHTVLFCRIDICTGFPFLVVKAGLYHICQNAAEGSKKADYHNLFWYALRSDLFVFSIGVCFAAIEERFTGSVRVVQALKWS